MVKIKLMCLNLSCVCLMLSVCCSNCIANPQCQKPSSILEVVIFHTKLNVRPKTLLIAANNVSSVLQSMPGFISRTVAKGTKSQEWLDIVRWKTLSQALLAAKKIVKNYDMKQFMAMMSDFKMYHFRTCQMNIKAKVRYFPATYSRKTS